MSLALARLLFLVSALACDCSTSSPPPPVGNPSPMYDALKLAWDDVRGDARWRAPTDEERTTLASVMHDLAKDAETCPPATLAQARRTLAKVDLALDELPTPTGGRILLLREATEHRGAGLLALRCGPATPLVLQAPHAFFDERTGGIVRAWFAEGAARAALWNTIHRYKALPGEKPEDRDHPADVTRQATSLFHVMTEALAGTREDLRFVQIHGFDEGDRPFDAVVSTGRDALPPTALATALEPLLGGVAAWGAETEELGGTLNVQGRMLARWPTARFLHVELSGALRRRLSREADLRASVLQVLESSAW